MFLETKGPVPGNHDADGQSHEKIWKQIPGEAGLEGKPL